MKVEKDTSSAAPKPYGEKSATTRSAATSTKNTEMYNRNKQKLF